MRPKLILLMILASIAGCTEQSDNKPTQNPAKAAQLPQLTGLAAFNGKPPNDLVHDAAVGKVIRSIVPQAKFQCMDDLFNYMPDLEAKNDGAVQGLLNGTGSHNFREAFVSASPNGKVSIVLNCSSEPLNKVFEFYSNAGSNEPTPKEIQDWLYMVGGEGDIVRWSDGATTRDIRFADFMGGMLAGAANPVPQAPMPPKNSESENEEKSLMANFTDRIQGFINTISDNVGKLGQPSTEQLVDSIWQGYTNYPGNSTPGISYVNVKGKLIKSGTVPPSAMNTSAENRLAAYLACYDFIMVINGVGDTKADLCVYYIDNPTTGMYAVNWKGKEYLGRLESKMQSDGFTIQ